MNETQIHEILLKQKDFFNSGKTLPVPQRVSALKRLKSAIKEHEKEISHALRADLGKSVVEAYMGEIGLVLDELSYLIRHTTKFAKNRRVRTPLAQFASTSFVKPSPYGTVLIMSPWNYPFLLTIDPLAEAIAAGNTVMVKPSAYSPNTSAVIEKIVSICFDPAQVCVINGGRQENRCLLNEQFDYIFFTGSQAVGREVMRCASEHLTPTTLELGGKSPCIVDKSANIDLSARRIVFGKFLNSGQTCIAPDYIYCHSSVKKHLLAALKKEITRQFGEAPLNSRDYGKMINQKHFDRVCGLIDEKRIYCGGQTELEACRIAPTVMDNIDWDDPIMQEEIFGPILPVLTFETIDQAINKVNSRPHPLAFYLFADDKKTIRKVLDQCSFGGGCVNDTIVHMTTCHMGFGGVGASGMGAYHGKVGFDTFSHLKSIVDKKTWLDLPMRYQPYSPLKEKIIRTFLK